MYDTILVPIDGSGTAERGLREAIALAALLKSRLVLLHVVDTYPVPVDLAPTPGMDDFRSLLLKYGEDVLEKGRRQVQQAGGACEPVLREVVAQRAADAIVDEASTRGCDLIVMGTHGRRGFSRLALGSDAERVLRDAPVPVLMVRGTDEHEQP